MNYNHIFVLFYIFVLIYNKTTLHLIFGASQLSKYPPVATSTLVNSS